VKLRIACLSLLLSVGSVVAGDDFLVKEFTYEGTNGFFSITNKNSGGNYCKFSGLVINGNVAFGTNFVGVLTSTSGLTNTFLQAFSFTNTHYFNTSISPVLRVDDEVKYSFSTNRDPATPYTNKVRYIVEF